MAEKRMFSNLILNNDDFIEMPNEAQMLYIRLNMAADDRGICDSPRTIMRTCGASNDSMKLLIAKKFVLIPSCKPTVVVIKHWWIHNNTRKERFKETKHIDVVSELYYDDNKSYSQNPNDGHISCVLNGKLIWPPDLPELMGGIVPALPSSGTQPAPVGYPTGTQRVPNGHPTGTHWVPQNRLDKNRLDKISVDNDREGGLRGEQAPAPGPVEKPGEQIIIPDPEKKRERIDFFVGRLQFFEQQGWASDCWYNMAEAEGITKGEIDLRKIQLEKQKEAQKK